MSEIGNFEIITIKFHVGKNRIYTRSQPNMTLGELKEDLQKTFNIPKQFILILQNNKLITNNQLLLSDLNPNHYGVIEQLELKSSSGLYQISVDYAYRDLIASDIITVHVRNDDGTIKDVVVEIVYKSIKKPKIGGYYDKKTKKYYDHNFSQTGPPKSDVIRNHRDTQAVFIRNRRLDQSYARATQMTNTETWIPTITDKILTAQRYETAEEYLQRITDKVRIIQRYFRAWKMRKCLKILHEEYQRRLQQSLAFEQFERDEDAKRRKLDIISKIFPRNSKDFSMLYSIVERWKTKEIERISLMYCGPAKIAEFYLLLEREIEALQMIERLKEDLKEDRQLREELDFFKTITTPISWICSYKNIKITVDTLETQKSREFYELYRKICDLNPDRNRRIDVLLDLKTILLPHKCTISLELIKLIDRNCELLTRGFSCKDIDLLQKRIEYLLLQHFQIDECNQNVTKRMKRLRAKHMKNNLYYCMNCYKLKTMEDYPITVRTDTLKVCKNCISVNKVEQPPVDISPYRFILKQIRRWEHLLHSTTSLAFIMQDKDIHLIITKIWHGHSILSECDDIYQLRLSRWDMKRDWSPWNCILLTQDEFKAHMRVVELNEVYDEHLIDHVHNKHTLARQIFHNCFDLDCF